ncbi:MULTISPECIES: biopolymer transporter ExbB [Roseinatronobacter]|uniref:Biopolymer transporter ExbB n=1 Tax=Roseinatronobacter domitianus TaxID=2940293 RepID=A0ABT0M357_9RHOB|nr:MULTISPECIES: biopolymer transporter ExbB [Roseibaca]MCL1629281.1 biopolymer transporter ExbB [Roseibaca domitiana]
MARSQFGVKTQFSRPVRQIVMMLLVIGLVAAASYVAYPRVSGIFLANVWLNGVIFCVFVIGVLATFWQVIQLNRSIVWIEGFAAERAGHEATVPPGLLMPLAALLRGRGRGAQIGSASAQSILDSVATRLDELRDITRYIINLLIFLGLLGTFYGLATTVPAVVETIRSLAPEENQTGIDVFSNLMSGLEAQLGGMGTAFSSSLLGLAGSLVVGLLELFAGHGQNRFYRQLEEWLSSITRLGFAGGDVEQGQELGAVVQVLDSMAEQMEAMRRQQMQADTERAQLDQALGLLVEAIDRLAGSNMGAGDPAMERIATAQEQILGYYQRDEGQGGPHSDAEIRLRLRNIDGQLLRISEELSAGRLETTADLRSDLSTLTLAVRQLSRAGFGTARKDGA